MKHKISFMLLFAALLAACSQDEAVTTGGKADGITMTVSDFVADSQTRTSLSLGNNGLKFSWSAGDVVGVFSQPTKQQVPIYMSGDTEVKSAIFLSEGFQLKEGVGYVAYYPIMDKVTAAPFVPVSYEGQTQTANNDYSHLAKYDYIVSDLETPEATNSVHFAFHHTGAILRLVMTMPKAGTWTGVTLSTTDEAFTTTATLDLFGETLIVPGTTSQSVTLALNDIETTADDNTLTAWFMLSPADFSSRTMTVTIKSKDGDDVVFQFSPAKDFQAGKAYSYTLPNVDHSKNPLLKWAESDLVYDKTTQTSSFASDYTVQGSLYQWGRNTGFSNYLDALGEEVSTLNGAWHEYATYGKHYNDGTGITSGKDNQSDYSYDAETDFAEAPSIFFMDPNGTDYWISSFGDGGSTWDERAEKCGYTTSLCPDGWRLPTKADFLEIKPSEAITGSEDLASVLDNRVELKTSDNGCTYAMRWSAETKSSKTYLRIDALVVSSTFSESELSSIDWDSNANVVTRYFGANGFIHAFYHLNIVQNNWRVDYFPVARPMPGTETHEDYLWRSKNGMYYTVLYNYIKDYSVNNEGYYWMSDDKMSFCFQDNTRIKTAQKTEDNVPTGVYPFRDSKSVFGFLTTNAQDCCAIRCVKAE